MGLVTVIIVAGGSGNRMGADVPKQFLELAGRPVLVHTVERFAETVPEADIIVALPAADIGKWEEISSAYALKCRSCKGGATRFESVKNALAEVSPESDYIMVHDGVRPLLTGDLILETLRVAEACSTAIPAVEPVDSFRILDEAGKSRYIDRRSLRSVQTPQVFRADILKSAYQNPYDERFTDDASVVEYSGVPVTLCGGERSNIKITTPEDMIVAEALLRAVNRE